MQKKVLALQDLSGFGRSSLVPIIGVLSAMGHQCVPVVTAVFSSHTAIAGYTLRDLTEDMLPALAQYEALGLRFDAVYSGFLGSEAQLGSVLHAARHLRAPGGVVLVDPVMGDNGKIYKTLPAALCRRMGELCHAADVITPNLTEAAVLLGRRADETPQDAAETAAWARELEQRYGAHVVLTGVAGGGDTVGVLCCEEGRLAFFEHARIRAYYPGTGDIFASVLLGALLRGEALADAAHRAAAFVRDCIADTAAAQTDPMYGVAFEPLLGQLLPQQNAASPL